MGSKTKIQNPLEGFEWDEHNIAHIAKHKVDPAEGEQVFFNKPIIIWYDADHSQNEERFGVLGITNNGRQLALVYTIRKSLIRILAARDQNKLERNLYQLEKQTK